MQIYLNPDGVLHPAFVQYENGSLPKLLAQQHVPFEHAHFLAKIMGGDENLKLVLNSWWPFFLGLEATLALLPTVLATNVVGTTLRHRSAYDATPSRIGEAEKHIANDSNDDFLILDHSNARYSKPLNSRAILLDGELGLASVAARRSLERRLAQVRR